MSRASAFASCSVDGEVTYFVPGFTTRTGILYGGECWGARDRPAGFETLTAECDSAAGLRKRPARCKVGQSLTLQVGTA